ncbi:MAG TPA: hypothetical protein DCP11_12115 [Microbacteriaceae bacterium]|jgi:hypothetical protein|nr:hypothetical protein [Microbacteriaceae bacterium]
MTTLAHRVVRQRGFLVSLVSAAVVFAVLVVQSVLSFLVSQLGHLGVGSSQGFQWWSFYGQQVGTVYVSFSVGVLVGLWFIAPVAAELRLAHVITRSALASAVGAVFAFLAVVVVSAVVLASEGLMGQAIFSRLTGESMLHALGAAFGTAGQEFVSATPLVILVGILLWNWLDRHPSKHHVSGIIDTA